MMILGGIHGRKTIPVQKEKSIQEMFQTLQENYTPVNVIKYVDFLKSKPIEEVLENSKFIFVEPTMGAQFLLESIQKASDDNISLLGDVYNAQLDYITKAISENYSNEEHFKVVSESFDVLKNRLMSFDIKDDTIRILKEQIEQLDIVIEQTIVSEHIGSMVPTVGYGEGSAPTSLLKQRTELEFATMFTETFMCEGEIRLENFNELLRTAYRYDKLVEQEEILTEGISDAVRKVAVGANKAAHKATSGLRRNMDNNHRTSVAVQKIPAHFERLIDNTLGRIQRMDQAERRKRIIEGGFKPKLLRILRDAILIGVAWKIKPAIAIVGILAKIAFDAKVDNDARNGIVDDLELELKMTKEKIKDAEHKNDNKKKYQLMRLQNALERDIRRIRLRQGGERLSNKGVTKQ